MTVGLQIPIIVRQKGIDTYELFAGYRRLTVYKDLAYSDSRYQKIEAIVMPESATDTEMIAIKIVENGKRTNLSKAEDIEEKLSALPFFFPNCGNNYAKNNLNLGYEILKLWNTYVRSNLTNLKSYEELNKLTNCDNAYQHLCIFFDTIGESRRTFFDNVSTYMNAPEDLLNLIIARKISFTRAKHLNAMKSKQEKEKIIKIITDSPKMLDKDIRILIDKSNLDSNPDLWSKKTKKYLEELTNLIGIKTLKKLSPAKKKDIDTHLALIHNILLQTEDTA